MEPPSWFRNLSDGRFAAGAGWESVPDAMYRGLAERVVRRDPSRVAIAVNLGAYWIKRGRGAEAIRLWQDALARNPGLTGARINLAVAQFQAGDPKAAEASLVKALQFDPDHALARKMLAEFRRRR